MRRPQSIRWDPEEYDSWYETPQGKLIDLIETDCVFSLLFPVRGSRILDVGCGSGNFALKLKNLGYNAVCLEPHPLMRERARMKGLECVDGVAEALPFDNETFDAVVSITAVEFFEDVEKAIDEMLRVVKRGGKVVVGFITGPWARFYEKKAKEGHPIFSHAHFPDVEIFTKHRNFKEIRFCLRSAPGEEVSWEREKELGEPGFACVLFERI